MKFEEVKGRFGFGCMRLKMVDNEVDLGEFNKMVDAFLDAGFNYFDTAHVYLGGKSELALKEGLTKRYPRDRYLLADKLTGVMFNSEADIRPAFESQLEALGVDYVDFYLMHSINAGNYDKYKECNAFKVASELKAEGKIRHLGMSFHDTPELLDKVLSEQKDAEFVQLQVNYLDFEDIRIQSRKCYEVCVKYGKPVVVMEPVKGGKLAALPEEASKNLKALEGGTDASYAIRFILDLENVFMVLSGMNTEEQMLDNLATAKADVRLNEEEKNAIKKVVDYINSQDEIACTSCAYCTPGCPAGIEIPFLFSKYNEWKRFKGEPDKAGLAGHIQREGGAFPSACIGCGQCEGICPQHLPIRDFLKKISETFE